MSILKQLFFKSNNCFRSKLIIIIKGNCEVVTDNDDKS